MNEDDTVGLFRQRFGCAAPPDDIERFVMGATHIAANMDTLVFDTDVPSAMSVGQAARKSVVAAVSDFSAKGVRPLWGMASIVAPSGYGQFDEMASGIGAASEEFGFRMVGGDTNRGPGVAITVCIIGEGIGWPGRGSATPGDIIMISGPFGLAPAGLHILQNGTGSLEGAVDAVLHPVTPLEFGIKAAPYFTSSMDSSDGLSSTLHSMATLSGTRMTITEDPAVDGLDRFAAETGTSLEGLIYHGGEEYETVFTVRPGGVDHILDIGAHTDTLVRVVGVVQEGSGVYVDGHSIVDGGWKAF